MEIYFSTFKNYLFWKNNNMKQNNMLYEKNVKLPAELPKDKTEINKRYINILELSNTITL